MSILLTAWDRITRAVETCVKPRIIQKLWHWLEAHVIIPIIVGSPNPGRYRTDVLPQYRWLFEQVQNPKVHFITFCSSARVGKTIFAILCILWKIVNNPGPILWVDPTRKTAMLFSRRELEHYMRECPPVAELIIDGRENWTTTEKTFKTCTLGLVGAGSAAELAGRQAEMLILNELDKYQTDFHSEAPPDQLAIVRTKQFWRTRKILRNSTPTAEHGLIWVAFLKGSQHYCYVPCPHCDHMQRLTFFAEKKDVPFDEQGQLLPRGTVRQEKTGRVKFDHIPRLDGTEKGKRDLERIERETVYECAACKEHIDFREELPWMLARCEWRSHNPDAHVEHISAHMSAIYSTFESLGGLAKKYLQAIGNAKAMHDFFNSDLGLFFKREAASVSKKEIKDIIDKSPPYHRGALPRMPTILTMCVDVQKESFWWSIRAWGIKEDDPELRSWNALIDWGQCFTWSEIERMAGLVASKDGSFNEYTFVDASGKHHAFRVGSGLVDSGYDAQRGHDVYTFVRLHPTIFSASKGFPGTRRQQEAVWVSESTDLGDSSLINYLDDYLKQQLYYATIKEQRVLWWLPRDVDDAYFDQITDERTEEDSKGNLVWVNTKNNHLGDTEKEHEVLRGWMENGILDEVRQRIIEEQEKAKAA